MGRKHILKKVYLKFPAALRAFKMVAGRFGRDPDYVYGNDNDNHGDNNHIWMH